MLNFRLFSIFSSEQRKSSRSKIELVKVSRSKPGWLRLARTFSFHFLISMSSAQLKTYISICCSAQRKGLILSCGWYLFRAKSNYQVKQTRVKSCKSCSCKLYWPEMTRQMAKTLLRSLIWLVAWRTLQASLSLWRERQEASRREGSRDQGAMLKSAGKEGEGTVQVNLNLHLHHVN